MVLGCFSGGENGPPLCLSAQPKCKISKKKGKRHQSQNCHFPVCVFPGVVCGISENRLDTADSPELLGFVLGHRSLRLHI